MVGIGRRLDGGSFSESNDVCLEARKAVAMTREKLSAIRQKKARATRLGIDRLLEQGQTAH